MVEVQSGFAELIARGTKIADTIEQASQPGILDALHLISPYVLDREDASAARKTIEEIRSMVGLGPLKEPILQYMQWCADCDEKFTRARCRTDRRATRFLSLARNLDRFLLKRIGPDAFVLRIREQITLLKSLEQEPPQPRRRRQAEDDSPRRVGLPEDTIESFLFRKGVQSIIASMFFGFFVGLVTLDLIRAASALMWVMTGFWIGVPCEVAYYVWRGTTRWVRIGRYGLLIAYFMSYTAVGGMQLGPLRAILGFYTDVLMIVVLTLTEAFARWGPLAIMEKVLDYIERGFLVAIALIIAYAVSVIIGQAIWVGMSILSFIYAMWKSTRSEAPTEGSTSPRQKTSPDGSSAT